MKTIAIIAAFNEADIIGPVIEDLISQGVFVYLIDHGSTDATRSVAEAFLGRGLLGIELFGATRDAVASDTFAWRAILQRKEALAQDLDADWFIHHDADEFRESPWAGVPLAAAIARVDAAGYNAIDFELLNFRPSDDSFVPGTDPRPVITAFERGAEWDKYQIKCWKKTANHVDLASSGGHDARFDGRRVFPLRFLLRHYPIRSQSHGQRKVFVERRSRLDPNERALGWHVQYDAIEEGHDFLAPAADVIPYEGDRVRLELVIRHRLVEELETAVTHAWRQLEDAGDADRQGNTAEQLDLAGAIRRAIDYRNRQLAASEDRLAKTSAQLADIRAERARLQAELETAWLARDDLSRRLADEEARRLAAEAGAERLLAWGRGIEKGQLETQGQLDAIRQSITWRWTTPIRDIAAWLLGWRRP